MSISVKTEAKIFEQGLEEHPKAGAVLGNLLMLAWIALGTAGCWFLQPVIAWIYLPVSLAVVFVILRKLVCTNCYYYGKWCPIGWGKLAALLFKKGNIEDFGQGIGVKLAPASYGLLSLIPIVSLIVAMIRDFAVPQAVVLAGILVLSGYSGAVSRRSSCKTCKMRLICPGCAVKEK